MGTTTEITYEQVVVMDGDEHGDQPHIDIIATEVTREHVHVVAADPDPPVTPPVDPPVDPVDDTDDDTDDDDDPVDPI